MRSLLIIAYDVYVIMVPKRRFVQSCPGKLVPKRPAPNYLISVHVFCVTLINRNSESLLSKNSLIIGVLFYISKSQNKIILKFAKE